MLGIEISFKRAMINKYTQSIPITGGRENL
jgi:hypothetical protein